MACDDKISNLCGSINYAACTKFEGTTNSQSDLSEEECLSVEETTQDIYNQLETLSDKVGGDIIIGTTISVNDINPDSEGNITLDSDDIPQGSINLYATAAEKATWNGKQDALGFVPVPETRTVNSIPLTSNITLTKANIGLGNVPNVDATNPNNILQDSTHRFVTDAQIAAWDAPPDDNIIELPYTSLLTLKTNSLLEVNKIYLITDYTTTYIQPITLTPMVSGVIEPLYVKAVDTNKLHNIAKSKLYPQDIVFYEITGDIGNGAGTEGFTKGKIYRRIDTVRNNDIGTDWRHVKYDRAGLDKLLFEDYNGCENNIIKEYSLFNNVVGEGFASNVIEKGFEGNTFGDFCTGNIIKQDCKFNETGNFFTNNEAEANFLNNTIGDDFNSNYIGSFFNANNIGNVFSGNDIKDSFSNNTIGDICLSNVIDDNFQNNTIGTVFQFNTILVDFISNIITDNFMYVSVNHNVNGKNFTLADIYSKSYTNTVTRKSNNTFQFSYVDGFGDIVTEDL